MTHWQTHKITTSSCWWHTCTRGGFEEDTPAHTPWERGTGGEDGQSHFFPFTDHPWSSHLTSPHQFLNLEEKLTDINLPNASCPESSPLPPPTQHLVKGTGHSKTKDVFKKKTPWTSPLQK